VPERGTIAIVDSADLTVFLVRDPEKTRHPRN
jgi:hypothetical protein